MTLPAATITPQSVAIENIVFPDSVIKTLYCSFVEWKIEKTQSGTAVLVE